MEFIYILLMTLLGAILGGFLFCIPGVNVYNLFGLFITFWISHAGIFTSPLMTMAFLMSLTVSFSFINTIPAFFFGAPDGSTLFLVAPGRKYLRQGRSRQSCMTVGIGGLIAIFLLVASSPLFFYLFRPLSKSIVPYRGWLIGALILYMIGSEFIYHLRRAVRFNRKSDYRALIAGPVIFLLIGCFGFVLLMSRRYEIDYRGGVLPSAWAGLILLPHLLWGLFKPAVPSPEEKKEISPAERRAALGGGIVGYIGGFLAVLLPGISAGLGAFLSGHLLPKGKEKAFLISQGMVKTFYHVGAFLLFFVPTAFIRRGGMALKLSPFYKPRVTQEYWMIIAVILISGALSFFLLGIASRLALRLVRKVAGRALAGGIIILVMVMTFLNVGFKGIGIMFLGTCLGSLPLLLGCRRSNVFAFLLLFIFLSMMGWQSFIATLLRIH